VKVNKGTAQRDGIIDVIQEWFRQNDMFWTLISFVTLVSIVILQVLFIFLASINPHIRNGIDSFLVPLLVLFVVSIFWRTSMATILSLAGVLCVYAGMFYIYDNQVLLQVTPSHIASKLGYGTTLTEAPLGIVANYYFFMGIIALILSTAVAFKPSIFRAKGAPAAGLPYPIWSNEKDPKLRYGRAVVSLIPVQSLLSIVEHHLVAKYRYIQIMIGGRIYFVSPEDWVPEHSSVVREKESGSLLGIPKVPDGFNL
jgi:hypothetical protein